MCKSSAWSIAFGGIFAGVGIVIMSLGTLIPIATFICPLICCLMGAVVLRLCGNRIAVAWYLSLAILSLLLSPDKEAAVVFAAFGYYPLLVNLFAGVRFAFVVKVLYFNSHIAIIYLLLLQLFGLSDVVKEYTDLGAIWISVLLIAGNITFFMTDLLIKRILAYGRRG